MYEAGASIYWLDLIRSLGGFEGDPVFDESSQFGTELVEGVGVLRDLALL